MEKKVRHWDDPKPRWAKKRRLQHFELNALECPYCFDNFKSNLQFALHVLRMHNFQNPEKKEVKEDATENTG